MSHCSEERVFDDVVSCELDEHPFDADHPCQATVVARGVKWQLQWLGTEEADTD